MNSKKSFRVYAELNGFTQGVMFYDILSLSVLVSDHSLEKVDIVTALQLCSMGLLELVACDTAHVWAWNGIIKSANNQVLVPLCRLVWSSCDHVRD